MIDVPAWANAKPEDFSFAGLKAAAEKLRELELPAPQRETLVVREIGDLPVESFKDITDGKISGGQLFGIKVKVSTVLPATVHDKDGNEVELLGILMSDDFDSLLGMEPDQAAKRIVFLTGKIVTPAKG